ncbi:pseudouridine synthase [Oceanicola sp. S124]|uniref:pseudouridine synthase n=1 Tax=Oceanicola sp. S124 TaxID=1042378 RepID=UPI0002557E3C
MSPKHPKRPAPRSDAAAKPAAGGPGAADSGAGGAPAGDRIAKVLARAGVASRRDAERMISEGRVSVNGRKIDSPALNVTAADRILVDDRPIGPPERTRLWLYHKPTGLVTTAKDEQGRETIFDALPEDLPRVMSVGRLDLNSEGLLLLTNDGALKRKLELPETGWVRKYRVRVKGNPSDESLAPLREGVVLDGEHFQPMAVSLDRQQGANAWLTVGLREGKNREIRRAMESVGLVVNRLIRVSYGPFLLGKLPAGEVEEIRPKVLRDQLGIELPEDEAPARRVTRKGRPPRGVIGGAGSSDDLRQQGRSGPRTGPRTGSGKPAGDRPSGGKPGGKMGSRRIRLGRRRWARRAPDGAIRGAANPSGSRSGASAGKFRSGPGGAEDSSRSFRGGAPKGKSFGKAGAAPARDRFGAEDGAGGRRPGQRGDSAAGPARRAATDTGPAGRTNRGDQPRGGKTFGKPSGKPSGKPAGKPSGKSSGPRGGKPGGGSRRG